MSTDTKALKCRFIIGKIESDVEFDRESGLVQWKTACNGHKFVDSQQIKACDIIHTELTDDSWSVHYVAKADNKWDVKLVTFNGEKDLCRQWEADIKAAVNEAAIDRPKRPLVFINPDGGAKTGVKDYRSKVAPLFEKAGITAEVIVTKDGCHAQRILAKYDLNTIDSLVAVGGDGTVITVVNALERRLMKDAGRDVDDPECQPISTEIPVGIIPTGSGQVLLQMCSGLETTDITTAALLIVLGHTSKTNMLSVHNNHQLRSYGLLSANYGVFGDMAITSESHRSQGRFRYIYALAKPTLKHRSFDMTIQYQLGDYNDHDTQDSKEWHSISGHYVMMNVVLYRVITDGDNSFMNGPALMYTLDESVGRLGTFKHIRGCLSRSNDVLDQEGIKQWNVQAVQYDLPQPEEGSDLQHVLNMDGEAVFLEPGHVLIRLHKKHIKVFGQIKNKS